MQPPLPVVFRLPQLGPIPPHRYLPWVCALLLALLAVVLLFYPGMFWPASWVSFDTQPRGTAVYLDGELRGSTPLRTKVAFGRHQLRLNKPFFEPQESVLEVDGRRVGQLFVRPRQTVRRQMSVQRQNAYNLLRFYWQDYLFRSLEAQDLPTFGRSYATPPLMGRALRDLVYQGGEAELEEGQVRELLLELLTKTSNASQLADWLTAALVQAYPRQIVGPWQLADAMKALRSRPVLRKEWERWRAQLVPAALRPPLAEWSRGLAEVVEPSPTEAAGLAPSRELAGMTFLLVDQPGIEPFYMQQGEVRYRDFAAFVRAQPEWGPDRKRGAPSVLPAEFGGQQPAPPPWRQYEDQLLGRSYLAPWLDGLPPQVLGPYPMAYVDSVAAEAFAGWLQQQLPSAWSGWQLALPSAGQWEQAVRGLPLHQVGLASLQQRYPPPLADVPAGRLAGTAGSLLEWTRSGFRPHPFLLSNQGLKDLVEWLDPPLRQVRGSSWWNSAGNSEREAWLLQNNVDLPDEEGGGAAVFPALQTSPFLGFRLVLQQQGAGRWRTGG